MVADINDAANTLAVAKPLLGSGRLTKSGDGTLVLAGENSSFSGGTTVADGTLRQDAQGAFGTASTYGVDKTGTLQLGGFNTGMAALDNAGSVEFGGRGGAKLAVAGDYTGNGGTFVINTVLGDDSSKTDLLQVSGDTLGATNVKVINQGGAGAATVHGIKLTDISGKPNGKFSLLGDYVTHDGHQAVVAGAMPIRCIRARTATGICVASRDPHPKIG